MLRVDADTYHPPKIGVWPMPTSASIVYLSGGSSPPFTPRCSQWYRLLMLLADRHKKKGATASRHCSPLSTLNSKLSTLNYSSPPVPSTSSPPPPFPALLVYVRLVTLEVTPSLMATAFTVVVSLSVTGPLYSVLALVGAEPSSV